MVFRHLALEDDVTSEGVLVVFIDLFRCIVADLAEVALTSDPAAHPDE